MGIYSPNILSIITIFFVLVCTLTASSQQDSVELKDIKYTVTIDPKTLVDTIEKLSKKITTLTETQDKLSENVDSMSESINEMKIKLAKIDERTIWIRGVVIGIAVALFGGIITVIVTYYY